eukprot:7390018-Prymnesium_polylepis.1
MYKKARDKAEAAKQLSGQRSVAHDLRTVYLQARESVREENKVKERLRELRLESADTGDEAAEPLITEFDACDVLGEAMAEMEAMLIIPEGFKISEPPLSSALEFSQPPTEESQALVGRRIMRKWEGFGWLAGVLTSVNSDGRRTIDKEKVNFFARFLRHGPGGGGARSARARARPVRYDGGRRVRLVAALGE